MKEIAVTYHLTEEQEARIQKMVDENIATGAAHGFTVEDEFRMMMGSGSRWDIDDKLKIHEQMHENGIRNRAKQKGGT